MQQNSHQNNNHQYGNSAQASANSGVRSLYFYTVIIFCVLAISIGSFILIRRVLIDTALPQLRADYSYAAERYYSPYCEEDNVDSDNRFRYNEEKCEEEQKSAEEREDKRYEQTRTEQYVYSVLTLIIAAIVAGVHVAFVRPRG